MTTREIAKVAVLMVMLSLAGCGTGSGDDEPSTTPSTNQGAIGLTDLTSIEQLRTLFNADRATPRLLLLLSPT